MGRRLLDYGSAKRQRVGTPSMEQILLGVMGTVAGATMEWDGDSWITALPSEKELELSLWSRFFWGRWGLSQEPRWNGTETPGLALF